MNNHFFSRSLPLLAAVALASGCVSMSKYKTLQAQEAQTSQSLQASQESLQASQARATALQQDNDKLKAALAEARKQMADLTAGIKSDLAQAQKGLDAALKRLAQDVEAPKDSAGSDAAATSPAPAH